eukprot:gnl/Spiro4/14241_TR7657_c0_g1_i2.p1 gnl/Spiro4/14241_TR7657_c0_g1~~gnl/Spiro4/14241_TR7657_c0_g1_i2.p1  ORF type:complete len:316 (-),score=67.54 gnl/Spiro4/14241_TR7657_c0_g1_i2:236-1081(-)
MGRVIAEEGDEEFWGQEFFQETADDDEFSEIEEEEDVVDSDFDDKEEDVPEEGVEVESNERSLRLEERRSSRLVNAKTPYRDLRKKPSAGRGSVAQPTTEVSPLTPAPRKKVRSAPAPPAEARTVRGSTRDATEQANFERDEREKILAAKRKERDARRATKVEVVWTQEDRLREAAVTEQLNKASLFEIMRRIEEDKKKNAPVKRRPAGPWTIEVSRRRDNGAKTVCFESPCAPFLNRPESVPAPSPLVCAVTGLPAKYRDPRTGTPFATVEAFRAIRATH